MVECAKMASSPRQGRWAGALERRERESHRFSQKGTQGKSLAPTRNPHTTTRPRKPKGAAPKGLLLLLWPGMQAEPCGTLGSMPATGKIGPD